MERIEATRELHIVHITMSFWLRMKEQKEKKRKEYRVEAKAARGTRLMEKQKKEEAKQHGCNSRWSQGKGGEVYFHLIRGQSYKSLFGYFSVV